MKLSENLYGPNVLENELSFEQIISQNEQKILNLIYGMTGDYHLSQDLTQETFLKAFQAQQTFQGKAKFSTWLYRIAVNVTIDFQRKSSNRNAVPTEEIQNSTPSGPTSDPDQQCQKNAIKKMLFSSIAQLPEQQKEVYVLREINGCTTKEVAEILDCTVPLVKWRLHKAKSALKKLLANIKYENTGTYTLTDQGLD